MNLHRSSNKPDWESIAPADRTILQTISAKSGGILSPANSITAIGLMMVLGGLVALLQQQFWLGLGLLAIGRLLDIVDGVVAEATKTKSPIGEVFDATVDKIGTVLTIIVMIGTGITHWVVIVALLIPQIAIPLVIFYKKQKRIAVHPTRQGKLSMALAWVGIIGLLVVKAVGDSQLLSITVYGIIGTSLILGIYALWQYSTGRD